TPSAFALSLRDALPICRGDPHLDHSAIFFSPGSRQESASLQAVKEPRQVRLKPDHPGPDLLAGEALGSRSPENPEGVVLGRRDRSEEHPSELQSQSKRV